jgi:hypothetical protein
MDKVEKLLAFEEIRALRARYFRGADTKDWVLMESVFAPDVVFDIRGVTTDPRTGVNVVPSVSEGVIVGSARVVQAIKEGITGVTCVHHGHMPELALTSDTTATGIWSMEDVLKWPDDAPIESMHGFGHYFETYQKIDGQWKIKTLKITRLMLDIKLR